MLPDQAGQMKRVGFGKNAADVLLQQHLDGEKDVFLVVDHQNGRVGQFAHYSKGTDKLSDFEHPIVR